MKLVIAAMCMFAATAVAAGANVLNVNKSGIALDGYDPVSYFREAGPQKGLDRLQTKVGDATYLFASEQNRAEFLKKPEKYEPQFGGWCAYAVAESKSKVDVDPKSFLIQDGRLLLFYKGFWGDTREKWSQSKDKDAKAFLRAADLNWPEVKGKEP